MATAGTATTTGTFRLCVSFILTFQHWWIIIFTIFTKVKRIPVLDLVTFVVFYKNSKIVSFVFIKISCLVCDPNFDFTYHNRELQELGTWTTFWTDWTFSHETEQFIYLK